MRRIGQPRPARSAVGTELRRDADLLRYRRIEWEIARRKAIRILEVGVHRAERATRFIDVALRHSPRVHYWGFDLFAELATRERLAAEAMPGGRPLSLADVRQQVERPGADIELIPGDTRVTLPEWSAKIGSLDIAFLDGGHSYETVRSDWLAIQPLMHDRSVVFLDDYITGPVAEKLGCGVATAVDEIDRSRYRVDLLHPIDTALTHGNPRVFRTRLARVTMTPSG